MADRHPRRWNSTEDQILREQVDAQQARGVGRDWCQVALALPGRTNKDCRKRWHNSVAEGLRKGQWSKSEDQLLTHGVHRYGSQWTKVATCVNTRSADQCAKRWQQSLDPRLDRSEWREHEDADLLAAVERLGRHWKDIQEQYLPQRSKNCVKNRYSVLSRRNASQLTPYDDSVEGSSSDPGTPLQLEVSSSLACSPSLSWHDPTQKSYGQTNTHDNGTGSTWPGSNDPNDFLAADYSVFYGDSSSPAHPSVHPSQVLSSNVDDLRYMHTAASMQQPMQHLTALPLHFTSYAYSMQQQPYGFTTTPYATSMAQGYSQFAPLPDSSNPHLQHGRQYRQADSAPFGWQQH